MNIFIYGQRSFGAAALAALQDAGHSIVGVAVSPQRQRKDKMVGAAILRGVRIYGDCDKMRAEDFPNGVDLVVSAHSHWMISDAVLAKCKHGGIGYHPSLLPRHRGQDAVRWTIHMGDAIAGGSIYRLGPECDKGDVLLQRFLHVAPGEDHHALWRRLFPEGVEMLVEAAALIERGKSAALWTPQDERFATWEPSWNRPRLQRPDLLMIDYK